MTCSSEVREVWDDLDMAECNNYGAGIFVQEYTFYDESKWPEEVVPFIARRRAGFEWITLKCGRAHQVTNAQISSMPYREDIGMITSALRFAWQGELSLETPEQALWWVYEVLHAEFAFFVADKGPAGQILFDAKGEATCLCRISMKNWNKTGCTFVPNRGLVVRPDYTPSVMRSGRYWKVTLHEFRRVDCGIYRWEFLVPEDGRDWPRPEIDIRLVEQIVYNCKEKETEVKPDLVESEQMESGVRMPDE